MATDIVTLDQVKVHLRLDASATAEDAYLKLLLSAAIRSIENETGHKIAATWPSLKEDDRTVVAQAALLLVGHWYINREAVGKDGGVMPMAVQYLLMPLKKLYC